MGKFGDTSVSEVRQEFVHAMNHRAVLVYHSSVDGDGYRLIAYNRHTCQFEVETGYTIVGKYESISDAVEAYNNLNI